MTQSPSFGTPLQFNLGSVPIVTLRGPDARRFANGMFTQNVRDLADGTGARSAMTDDRGRVLGLLDIYCTDPESFLLVLEGVDGDWFQSRYGKFIVFDDVELEDLTGTLNLLSIQGAGAADCLTAALGSSLQERGYQEVDGLRLLQRQRTSGQGWDLLVPTDRLSAVTAALSEHGARAASPDDLRSLRIHLGLPTWPEDRTGERTFVHELRLRDEVCNFNKGCYVGQEVINRMDTMGKLTRQLQGLLIQGSAPPLAGAALHLEGDQVGTLGSAALVSGRVEALAVLRKKAWAVGTQIEVGEPGSGILATVCELPFS